MRYILIKYILIRYKGNYPPADIHLGNSIRYPSPVKGPYIIIKL